MKTLQRALTIAVFAVLSMSTAAAAQVTFSGDARFRPRIDLDDRTEDPSRQYKSTQFYYMYRLRLNMTAGIGDGFYVKSRLAHNGIAFYQKGGEGKLPDIFGNDANTVSDESAVRPELDLSYMYIGRATETFGYDLGIIPVPGFSNPLFDLHFYPNLMIDVPYFIWNTDGAFGGKGYVDVGPGRLSGYLLLDREVEESREADDGTTLADRSDQYTFVAAYAIPAGDITIEPTIMKTFGGSHSTFVAGTETVLNYNAPTTIGANITFPEFDGLTPSATFGYTTNDEANTEDSPVTEYSGWLGRFKLTGAIGPGTLLAWVDLASRTDDLPGGAGEISNDFMYSWLAYSFTIYSGENGSFRITPEWRFINYDQEDLNMRTRHKFEINFDASFR